MIHTIITHGGYLHADETFACAALQFLYPNTRILRRNPTPEELADPEIAVIDIGDIYNPEKACFDHHQPEGSVGDETLRPKHARNGPMASFGMIWNQFAIQIIESVRTGTPEMVKTVAAKVRASLVRSVDAEDNGLFTDSFTVSKMLIRYNSLGLPGDEAFGLARTTAREILEREIHWHWQAAEAAILVQATIDATTGHTLMLQTMLPWKGTAAQNPNILFAVYPSNRTGWVVECCPPSGKPMEQKMPLPEWTVTDTQKRTEFGITFAHTARFLAVCDSEANAVRLTRHIVETHIPTETTTIP